MARHLSILSRAPADDVVALADDVLVQLDDVRVLRNRTGIVMLPYTDSARGVTFLMGEVLMAEAHVQARLPSGREAEGYGACLGRNLRFALALALLDLAWRHDVAKPELEQFVLQQAAALKRHDADLLARVEATRVRMETF